MQKLALPLHILPLCLSAFLSQAWISSQHSHLRASLEGRDSRPHGLFGSLAGQQFPGLKGSAVGCLRNWHPFGVPEGMLLVFFRVGGISCGWLAWRGHWQLPNSDAPARACWALTHYTATHRKRPEALEARCSKSPWQIHKKTIRRLIYLGCSRCNVSQLSILQTITCCNMGCGEA